MTEQETREKIVGIITHEYVTDKDYAYIFDPRIEEKINNMADALIAAGIGDVSEYKHRAEVAENELKLYKLAVKIWQERYSDIRCFNFNIALRQAEKELAEEGKDVE